MEPLLKNLTFEHKQSISERYREAVKANDVDGMDLFKAIRKRAYELGYTEKQLQEVYREVRNESSRDKQHTEPVPEPKPPATEEVQELPKLQGTEQKLSRRVEYSNAGTGGRPERKSKLSIIDMAEGRS